MAQWDTVVLEDDNGVMQNGVAPVIVSASRSTDIPAFYSDWLVHRLNHGYCIWINPFNGVPQYVSFAKTRFFVFWSKNPAPLIEKLPEFDKRNIGYYFQFTLNDYEKEKYEPNVPPLEKRIEIFQRLSGKIGRSRVIWRFDPLLLTPQLSFDELLSRIDRLMRALHEYTEKLVFSFADIGSYPKVQSNLRREKIDAREFTEEEMALMAVKIRELAGNYKNLQIATCAEKMDFDGIAHNRCIDDSLIAHCRPDDAELMQFLGRNLLSRSGVLLNIGSGAPRSSAKLKDKGQRKYCGCIASKDIGAYNTCGHLCVYCYANSSQQHVRRRVQLHSPKSEAL